MLGALLAAAIVAFRHQTLREIPVAALPEIRQAALAAEQEGNGHSAAAPSRSADA